MKTRTEGGWMWEVNGEQHLGRTAVETNTWQQNMKLSYFWWQNFCGSLHRRIKLEICMWRFPLFASRQSWSDSCAHNYAAIGGNRQCLIWLLQGKAFHFFFFFLIPVSPVVYTDLPLVISTTYLENMKFTDLVDFLTLHIGAKPLILLISNPLWNQ